MGESFWWCIATINSRVKTSKVDLSVKVMLPLYQALMLQGRTVRQQPPRQCLTIYFPSRSFFIRDGFAQNGFQSTGIKNGGMRMNVQVLLVRMNWHKRRGIHWTPIPAHFATSTHG
ncbi:hypothetical protein HanRHA438_Chr09g0398341 [Helianthus annuus]|nr:hypothetical protein HanIR_Chr09g0417151 [Helianthus annuus]KAJ0888109.1 hypothetical protein HanRHA438_Chr09g0398341 [Helianthus annuus]